MSARFIYKIEILNWDKHNKKSKPSYPYILLSKRFFDDAKVQSLPAGGKLLLLGLMLRRGDVEHTFIEASHEDLVRLAGGSGQVVQRLLDLLQSFQLLRYEKMPSNRIEKNIIEKKRKELPDTSKVSEKDDNKKIKEAYFNAYRLRYGIEPISNASFNSQVSNLRKKIGVNEAVQLVEFYLKHNDGFYLKNTHSFGLCLSNVDTLRTQMLRNQPITSVHVKQLEKSLDQASIAQDNSKRIQDLFEKKQKQISGGSNES